jgi:DNA-binding transcriptional ArsR family regulator
MLSHPARLLMLLELARAGEAHASALARAAGHNLPSACNHLRLLCHAGVVERRAEGQRQLYRLASEEVRNLLGLVR